MLQKQFQEAYCCPEKAGNGHGVATGWRKACGLFFKISRSSIWNIWRLSTSVGFATVIGEKIPPAKFSSLNGIYTFFIINSFFVKYLSVFLAVCAVLDADESSPMQLLVAAVDYL